MNKPNILENIRRFEGWMPTEEEGDTLRKVRQSERDAYLKALEATKALLDATNTMGSDAAVQAGIVQGILRTHRHLQGQGIIALLSALGHFGRLDGNEDPRNAHAKATCKLLPEALRNHIYWAD